MTQPKREKKLREENEESPSSKPPSVVPIKMKVGRHLRNQRDGTEHSPTSPILTEQVEMLEGEKHSQGLARGNAKAS